MRDRVLDPHIYWDHGCAQPGDFRRVLSCTRAFLCSREGAGPLFPLSRALRAVLGVQQERSTYGAASLLPQQQGRGKAAQQGERCAAPPRPVLVQGRVIW